MIGYRDNLYIFGGEVGFSNGVETPLWIYNITVRPNLFAYFSIHFYVYIHLDVKIKNISLIIDSKIQKT